jgi:Flp pilus assembly protein TadG
VIRSAATRARRRIARWVRRLGVRDRGAVTLQYVIIVPAMFTLIFTCIQVAMYSYARSVALAAAQEGVNAQRVYHAPAGTGYDQAMRLIRSQGDTLRGAGVTVQIQGSEVVVTVTGRTQSVLPGFGGYLIIQSASGPIEEFRS